ncbi:amino acid ABC transporter permease [Musicola paradisiaca]|uniref:Glutamate/aspartate import permease protein GltK n=1 Tax=Musicola paradisiaca (strain Ech703) TaxID=579405 RepID=C6C3H8_MUSP7|nr:amino acid ABC transporter permease [Musicola paradisiaca]ACS87276.1 polar amino acid ABC transporter, inner membrane subunit [Musicola paradisiaca Ech703]
MNTSPLPDVENAPVRNNKYVDLSHYEYVPRRYYGRITATVVIVVLLAALVHAFSRGNIEWSYVGQFFTAKAILDGVVNTLVMAVLAMALGILFGVIAAIMHMSPNPVLHYVSVGYAWIFRGTPLILQLLLWFNLALVFPRITLPGVFSVETVTVMTPFFAALLGLSINQGAYTSEVVRAGLLSVDIGQYEAAKAIGMPRLQALRRIILPQAMRVIIPPVGNEFISMIKTTSLASMIQYSELLYNTQNIYYANARVMELLFVAGIWYLMVVTVLSFGQNRLEKYFSRGNRRRA